MHQLGLLYIVLHHQKKINTTHTIAHLISLRCRFTEAPSRRIRIPCSVLSIRKKNHAHVGLLLNVHLHTLQENLGTVEECSKI